jgi:integrase
VLLFHAPRRAEVSALKVEDYAPRRGIVTLCVHGKGGKIRYVPVKPSAITLIEEYLDAAATAATRRGRFSVQSNATTDA